MKTRGRHRNTIMGKRKILILAGLATFTCLYLLSIHFDVEAMTWRRDLRGNERSKSSSLKHAERQRTILFWNSFFGDENFEFGNGDYFQHCPRANNCFATHDRHYQNLETFDAILFHGNSLSRLDLPAIRRPAQSYVFVNMESPINAPLTDSFFEDFFNLTMTYRIDSDIPWQYGIVEDVNNGKMVAPLKNTTWLSAPGRLGYKFIAGNRTKTRMAAWIVSNCHTRSKREHYVEELRKYIPVDVFGKCGSEPLCNGYEDCFSQLVEPNYFFYLSFENSFCEDYVTEKLYNALSYDVVPIVYGGADYGIFAPPHSYVNALDFNSPKDLAEFMKNLVEIPGEYGRYYWWKKYYRIAEAKTRTICKLCELLHEETKTKIYDQLSGWFRSDRCPMEEELRAVQYATKLMITNPREYH